jgi:predicted transcriptional regulator
LSINTKKSRKRKSCRKFLLTKLKQLDCYWISENEENFSNKMILEELQALEKENIVYSRKSLSDGRKRSYYLK